MQRTGPAATAGDLLVWLVVTLLGLGVLMVTSADLRVTEKPATVWELLWARPLLYAAIAVVAMGIAATVNLRWVASLPAWINPIPWALLISVGLCGVVLLPEVGRTIHGARRWLSVGGVVTFQPSELAKWTLPIALAWWAARRGSGMRRFWTGLVPPLAGTALVAGLIGVEDFGTAVLIAAVAACLLAGAGARLWQLGLFVPPAVAGGVTLIVTSTYRVERITAFLEPFKQPKDAGYHLIQSLLAIADGGLSGVGLGNGVQKHGYLPADTTDFLFATICEELGLGGAVLVIGLYLSLLWVGSSVVRDCPRPFGRLLGAGILLTVGFQAVMNLCVVTGLVPPKGIALPLVSRGGTGWVLGAAAIGLLVAADRLNRRGGWHDATHPPDDGGSAVA